VKGKYMSEYQWLFFVAVAVIAALYWDKILYKKGK